MESNKQVNVIMDSSLGPTLSNAFICYYDNIWLKNKTLDFRWYVDVCIIYIKIWNGKVFQGSCKAVDFQVKKELMVPIPKSFFDILISHKNEFSTASI